MSEIIAENERLAELAKQHEPLMRAPQWQDGKAAGWYADSFTGSYRHAPTAYEHGFEAGAFALGNKIFNLFAEGKGTEAIEILRGYHSGIAHPIRGWAYEPKRK